MSLDAFDDVHYHIDGQDCEDVAIDFELLHRAASVSFTLVDNTEFQISDDGKTIHVIANGDAEQRGMVMSLARLARKLLANYQIASYTAPIDMDMECIQPKDGGFYVYKIPPIDYGFELYRTAADVLFEYKEAGDTYMFEETASDYQLALHVMRKAGWEGDGVVQVVAMPTEGSGGGQYCGFLVRQKNDGLTFLAFPEPIAWLIADDFIDMGYITLDDCQLPKRSKPAGGYLLCNSESERLELLSKKIADHLDQSPEPTPEIERVPTTYNKIKRDSTFRQRVLEAYGAVCVICGYSNYVEAAHLVPKHQMNDDRTENGAPLCPNHHWELDNGLITVDEVVGRRTYCTLTNTDTSEWTTPLQLN